MYAASANREVSRKIFALILLFVLLMTARAERSLVFADTHFKLNRSPYFPNGITISGDELTVYGIPETEDYNYIMLLLKDSNEKDVFREVSSGNHNGKAAFFLHSLSEGPYSVYLYHSSRRYAVYESDLWDSLMMTRENDVWKFSRSPALEGNLRKAAEERTDVEALTFYLQPTACIQSEDPVITEMSEAITEGYRDSYYKALAIYNWVCNNIFYDYDAVNHRKNYHDFSAAGVLNSRLSVCEGYANLTIALLRAAGIPAKMIDGYALGITEGDTWPQGVYDGSPFESNHAWVEAYIDEHWAIMDPTWDSVNAYEYGQVTNNGLSSYRYFDISQELFAIDHAVVNNSHFDSMYLYLNYPMLWNGSEWKKFDSSGSVPFMKKGRTMVPLRAVIEEMGGSVYCQDNPLASSRVTCYLNGYTVELQINSRKYYINGKGYLFDLPPQIIAGQIMVPARHLFPLIGCQLQWESSVDNWNGRITINYLR